MPEQWMFVNATLFRKKNCIVMILAPPKAVSKIKILIRDSKFLDLSNAIFFFCIVEYSGGKT